MHRVNKKYIRSKLIEAITLLTCIWEIPGSSLGRYIDNTEVFRGFAQSLYANANILP
jgi:hypothetical protein